MTEPVSTNEATENRGARTLGRGLAAALVSGLVTLVVVAVVDPLIPARVASALPWRAAREWAIQRAYDVVRKASPEREAECCELIASTLSHSPNSNAWIKLNLILTRTPRPPELEAWLRQRSLALLAHGERDHGTWGRVALECFEGLESDPRFVQVVRDRLRAAPDNAFLQNLTRQLERPAARAPGK